MSRSCGELTERARTGGLKLTGQGGLLGRLTNMVVEGALEGELDDHLGYGKHDPEGRDGGNSRNGHRAKTVLTDTGPAEISVPRDRDSSFEPKIVAKRQRRLTGADEIVISLSAKGLTHGEICAHLAEVYGAEVSKQTITAITDRVMECLADWQSRPLDAVYAVVFIDAINVKIREGQVASRPIYLALGVTVDGERDGLWAVGLWAGEHGDGEGAKYWMRVCSEIKNRGTRNAMDFSLISVCGQLSGGRYRRGWWLRSVTGIGAARVSLLGGQPVPRPAVRARIRGGGGQAAAGAQMLTWAASVRVVTPRPAAGNAGRVLVLRSRCRFRPVMTRRLPRSCRVP